MTTKHSSIRLASEGEFQTTSTDSLSEMRAMVAEYESDPNGAVLDGWEPREGTIITEVRAISARINQNFDAWPSEELRQAHHTFVGKPVFVNHNNHDPSRARGRVVASRYVDAGEDDRYVQVLQEVEASRFPLLAKELMEGGLDSVSMGAEAREVECSFCGNISTTPFDACQHIPMKGSTLQRRTANGSPEDVLIYEICRKISFFELSYVFDPADETAVASRVLVAGTTIEAPPKVDTLHPDEDEKSNDDWHEYVDDPNVIDTIDVLDEPDLGLNQELERPEDEVPEGFEEFSDIDDQIEENEQAEAELAQDARQKSQDKEEAEAAERQRQFEQQPSEGEAPKDPENDDDWDEEEDATGSTHRFKGGSLEIMVANDFGSVNMWVEKNGSLIASDTYPTVTEAKEAAIAVAKEHRAKTNKESKMSRTARRKQASFEEFRNLLLDYGAMDDVNTATVPELMATFDALITMFEEDGEDAQELKDGLENLKFDSGYPYGAQASRRKQASRKTAAPLDGWDMSFNNASATFQERDFQLWVATDDYDDGTENWQMGEWSVYDSTFSEVASGHENSVNSAVWAAIIAAEEEGFDTGSVPASGNTNASRNGAERTSRTKNRDTSRRSNRMAPQRRRRTGGENKQTPLLEDTGIAQTPAEEAPVDTDLDNGSDAPNNSESDRVKSARRALARELARERAARERAARRRKAEAVGADESGDNVDREDLFEDYPATTMTARVRNRFASWVQSNYGCDLREASGPGELRTWARSFSRKADIDLATIHSAIKKDIVALRTAADDDDDEGVSGDEASKDDVPDFIEDKIEEDGDSPSKDDLEEVEDDKKESSRRRRPTAGQKAVARRRRQAGEVPESFKENWDSDTPDEDEKKESAAKRRAALRRRAAQQASRRGRTNTTRRKTADDKLDLAAPDERVNVEKPTSGTTDADAEASQFDRDDFDNNSGKGLENPDTTGTPGIPGGPSANDFKRSSARASGLQAVRLAEAMIAAGLVEDTTEAKFKAAAEFEKMSRDIVLDRTALLEKVAKVQTARRANSTTKSAGNRGASLNSAVPPNMSGMARSSAPQRRESSTANDSDLFL